MRPARGDRGQILAGLLVAIAVMLILTAGLKVFLFPDNDIDGDGLSNDEEEELGTNPYVV